MIQVIGVSGSLEDLSRKSLSLLEEAEIIVASQRFLPELKKFKAKVYPLKAAELASLLTFLKENLDRSVALLLSGDPLFFGFGKRLCKALPPEKLVFHPAPSSVQLALSRLKIPWEEAKIVSLHGRKPKNLHLEIAPYQVAVFLTDPENNPARLGAYFLEKGLKARAYVAENLGYPEEKIISLPLEELPKHEFSPLNLLILEKEPQRRRLDFGRPETHYRHRHGLITKAETRAMIVASLSPFPEATVWDLGAGSGAVGLELAELCFRGETHLVEKEASRIEVLRENMKASLLDNVILWEKEIKEVIGLLPSPDLVFVGGGWPQLQELGTTFLQRLKPETRLAATFASLEHLTQALSFLEKAGFETAFSALWVARGYLFPDGSHGLSAQNPVFLLRARRKDV